MAYKTNIVFRPLSVEIKTKMKNSYLIKISAIITVFFFVSSFFLYILENNKLSEFIEITINNAIFYLIAFFVFSASLIFISTLLTKKYTIDEKTKHLKFNIDQIFPLTGSECFIYQNGNSDFLIFGNSDTKIRIFLSNLPIYVKAELRNFLAKMHISILEKNIEIIDVSEQIPFLTNVKFNQVSDRYEISNKHFRLVKTVQLWILANAIVFIVLIVAQIGFSAGGIFWSGVISDGMPFLYGFNYLVVIGFISVFFYNLKYSQNYIFQINESIIEYKSLKFDPDKLNFNRSKIIDIYQEKYCNAYYDIDGQGVLLVISDDQKILSDLFKGL